MPIDLLPPLRLATQADAADLAELVNIAGEGLPFYLWAKMAGKGETPWDVGRARAIRESGAFSYRNAVVREDHGSVAAVLIGYPLEDEPALTDYTSMPPMFVPMQELEDLARGTWYVNVLATRPEFRGRGYGTVLLANAERLAVATRKRGMSLIVADANLGARRLYERCGYREFATRPIIKNGWQSAAASWVLLVRDF